MSRVNFAFIFATLPLVVSAGCASRKAAATQTSTPFDATKSDPKAVAIADQVLTALGGEANWNKTKEVVWTQAVVVDGNLKDYSKHAYDRWNGRHQFSTVDGRGQLGVVMRELYSAVKFAYVQGEKGRATQMKEDTARMADTAQKRLDLDGYRLLFPFKLKDPGVHLAFSEERPADDDKSPKPEMKIDVIKVTFDPNIGPAAGDVYYLAADKATHMPIQIEHVPAGRPDTERSAIRLDTWKDSNGLKFPTKFTNIGYSSPDAKMVPVTLPEAWKAVAEDAGINVASMPQVPSKSEIVFVVNIKASDSVEEDLYVPNVNVQ